MNRGVEAVAEEPEHSPRFFRDEAHVLDSSAIPNAKAVSQVGFRDLPLCKHAIGPIEVDPSVLGEADVAPHPWIDLEELVFAVPRIMDEFQVPGPVKRSASKARPAASMRPGGRTVTALMVAPTPRG